jgi:hypothetical protein
MHGAKNINMVIMLYFHLISVVFGLLEHNVHFNISLQFWLIKIEIIFGSILVQ